MIFTRPAAHDNTSSFTLDSFIGQPTTAATMNSLYQQTGQWVVHSNALSDSTTSGMYIQNVRYEINPNTSYTTGGLWNDGTYGDATVSWNQFVSDDRKYTVNRNVITNANYRVMDWMVDKYSGSSHLWVPDKKAEFKDKIRRQLSETQRLNHLGKTRRAHAPGADFSSAKVNEMTALHLLRKMTDSDTFRRYLRTGVLSVRGPSGLYYAIRRKSHFIDVYYNQRHVSKLCVFVARKYNCPPTDDVIAKMITIECDEPDIWRKSNWHILPDELREVAAVKEKVTARTLLKLVA